MLAPADPVASSSPSAPDSPPAPARLPWRGLRTVTLLTLLSRVLGLVRDMSMAAFFGVGPAMDAFTIAFRIPNLFRRLFGEGALATSFLPVLARELETCPKEDRTRVWQVASAVLGGVTLGLTVVVILAEIGLWAALLQTGISPDTRLLLESTALLLPYVVLICLAAQMSAVLNALGHFTWPASVPVVLNAVWLGALWWYLPTVASIEQQVRALSAWILAAGVLQVLIQWPALRGFGFRLRSDWTAVRPAVREILQSMLPVLIGLSVTQLNTLADSCIAWSFSPPLGDPLARMPLPGGPAYPLQPGAVSALYFGERMYQFPIGVFGVALGTVLFPLLARHAARGDLNGLRADLTLGLRLVIAIALPGSVGLMVCATPIARAFFERGAFDPQATVRTAQVIVAYGSGVWAYCAILILQRGFYAIGDRITPLRIGVITVAVNFGANLTLIWWMAESGLAWSTAGAAALQTTLLVMMLQSRVGRMDWGPIVRTTLTTTAAALVMSLAAWGADLFCHATPIFSGRAAGLLIPLLAASAAFLVMAWLLRLEELAWLVRRDPRSNTERSQSPE